LVLEFPVALAFAVAVGFVLEFGGFVELELVGEVAVVLGADRDVVVVAGAPPNSVINDS
jgi:hypothetical protein